MTKALGFQLSGELLELTQTQAKKEERNVSSMIRYALRKYLEASAEPAKVPVEAATPVHYRGQHE